MKEIAIIGGGAAGFFTAANLEKKAGKKTVIFEQSASPLQKVRISGGGRCNLTHACFDPAELVEFYPRGKKELLGVFHKFQPGDTMDWFEKRGVLLKVEDDNRVFPVSDSSLSIIECLMNLTEKNGVEIKYSEVVKNISITENGFLVQTKSEEYYFKKVVFTPGAGAKANEILRSLGHKIIPTVPSLFTFNIKDKRLDDLMGISFDCAAINIPDLKLESEGSLLITHWGLSGPGILKLSAWGAIELKNLNYEFSIKINFIQKEKQECSEILNLLKTTHSGKSVYKFNPFGFPKRFWHRLLEISEISQQQTYSNLTKKQILNLTEELTSGLYRVKGKSTFKDEFVTAGGLDLKEIDFKTMESKIVPNLFVAGEILNIDAITGGFNFQQCWSGGFLISKHLNSIYST